MEAEEKYRDEAVCISAVMNDEQRHLSVTVPVLKDKYNTNTNKIDPAYKKELERIMRHVAYTIYFQAYDDGQNEVQLEICKTQASESAMRLYHKTLGKNGKWKIYSGDTKVLGNENTVQEFDECYRIQRQVHPQGIIDLSPVIGSTYHAGYLEAWNDLNFIQKRPILSVISSLGIGAAAVGLAWWWKTKA